MTDSHHECISVLEYTEEAADFDKNPGERVIVGGIRRDTHVPDDEKEGFVKIAEAVAVIELHEPIAEDEVTDWCNSEAGKLALSHFFDHTDPMEVAAP